MWEESGDPPYKSAFEEDECCVMDFVPFVFPAPGWGAKTFKEVRRVL
jgi:hypothetical protein